MKSSDAPITTTAAAFLNEFSVNHFVNMIGNLQNRGIVRCHTNRNLFGANNLLEDRHYLRGHLRIQLGRRFIREKQTRPWAIALAMATRCCSPPDSSKGR